TAKRRAHAGIFLMAVAALCSSCTPASEVGFEDFVGKETPEVESLDEVNRNRTALVQDVSVLFGAEQADYNAAMWDFGGYTVLAACGNGQTFKTSDLVEFVVVESSYATDDVLAKAENGEYDEYAANTECHPQE
ncbi:MAG: hypothetical protein ACTHW1_11325, partial [Ancrocorticia sp.]